MHPPECTHIKTDGIRCGSPAKRGQVFCFYHGRPARTRFRRPVTFQLPVITDTAAYLYALHVVIEALSEDRMEVNRASALIHALQLSHANLGGL